MSSQFQQEFPSLQAAGEIEKADGPEEEPYGPGPSLRPQSTCHTLTPLYCLHLIHFHFLSIICGLVK